jgi:hypothetical protein
VADPYIDQFETQIYGLFAREQMKEVCLGRIEKLDPLVHFAIAAQKKADDKMKEALDRQPAPRPALSEEDALTEARDVIIRFGSYIGSLKGRPIDPKVFFRNEPPSLLARRRITKLVAGMKHIVDEFDKQKKHMGDAKTWQTELTTAYENLATVEKQHRAHRVERADLAPDVAAARAAWLTVYNANKSLIEGLLAHAGKPELLPLVFDDLAEVHRVSGVSDAAPAEPGTPAVPAAPPAVQSPPATA